MRKISVAIGLILLVLSSLNLYAYGKKEEPFPYDRDPQYIDYKYDFKPLEENETLFLKYGDRRLSVYARSSNGSTRLIGTWDNAGWASWIFSEDRKTMLFGLKKRGLYYPRFILNGSKGNVKYLFECPNVNKVTIDFKYLVGKDYSFFRESYATIESQKAVEFRYAVIDLRKNKFVGYINWKIDRGLGGSVTILRSIRPNYDIRIIYKVEGTLWAECYYNIEEKKLDIVLDDTALGKWRSYPVEYTDEETGWVPPEGFY